MDKERHEREIAKRLREEAKAHSGSEAERAVIEQLAEDHEREAVRHRERKAADRGGGLRRGH